MQCDVHTLECLTSTGNFSPSFYLLLINAAHCCPKLLYFFRYPLIQPNASVPALCESFVYGPSLLNALLMVWDEPRFQLYVLGPLIVVVLLRLPVH